MCYGGAASGKIGVPCGRRSAVGRTLVITSTYKRVQERKQFHSFSPLQYTSGTTFI